MTNKPQSTMQTNVKLGQLQGLAGICLKSTLTSKYLPGEEGPVD